MVEFIPPGSAYAQVSNVFFLLSGVFNDLLLIRWCLVWAFLFLMIQALLGFPAWGTNPKYKGEIGWDVVMWCTIQIVLIHGHDVILMYMDERKPKLNEDELKLWRYIYRHSGLSQLQFRDMIVPTLKVVTFEQGEYIPVSDYLYIILEGTVEADVSGNPQNAVSEKHKITMSSGQMFPLTHIYVNYMSRNSYFAREFMEPVAASKKVKAFVIPAETLEGISLNPKAAVTWKAMLISALGQIAEKPFRKKGKDDFFEEGVSPLFDPLVESEEPFPDSAGSTKTLSRPFRHIWHYMKITFYVPWPIGNWPVGLRHCLSPPKDPHHVKVKTVLIDADDHLLRSSRCKLDSYRRQSFSSMG